MIIKQIIKKIFKLDDEPCQSCETLREQLNIVNHEKRQMLETILDFTKPAVVEIKPADPREIKPILPRASTWKIRQQELEKNDREEARLIRERQQAVAQSTSGSAAEIEKLEEEVGLKDASA